MAKVKLGDIAETALGKMLDAKKNKGELHPYLANIHVRWGEFDLEDLPLMRFEDSEAERFSLRDGDLVMCEGGEPGRCAIWREQLPDVRYQKALHRIRPHENVDVRWLYYWFLLQGRVGGLNKYFVETTIKHLVGADLRTVEIDLPELDKQIAVADVLATIDDIIANNKKLMVELEATARLIYDYWFTQFDFPDENDKPYRSSGGKMVWSDELKREIPINWTAGTLSSACRYSENSIAADILDADTYISLDNMLPNYGGIVSSDYCPSAGTCKAYSAGDTLFGNIRPYFKKVYLAPRDGGCSPDVLILRPIGNASSFVYETVACDFFVGYVTAGAKGTKMPRGDKDHIMRFKMAVPPQNIISAFEEVVGPIHECRSHLAEESNTLASLRNWLLPMLMNGQLHVE